MALGWPSIVRAAAHTPARALLAVLAAAGALALSSPQPALAATASSGPGPNPVPGPGAGAARQPSGGAEPAQEITLETLGIGPQVVQGGSGSVEVLLPAPAGPLAAAGSFTRVVFAHSPLLDASASSLTLAVNGQPLTSVRLDGSNADASAVEVRAPGSALHGDRPNLLQARFELKLGGGSATGDPAAYARLEPQTLLHYQLYGPPGSRPPPRLESYPFPFASRAGDSGVGFVLPRPVTEADAQAALRLAADLGKRVLVQPPQPEVVSAGSADWLRTAARPAVLVGTIGRLPLAESVLQAAGFGGSPGGWRAPDGRQLRPTDGVLAAVTSPFDGQSPLLLVTGFTDEGLARAAAALSGAAGPLPPGSYAVVGEAVGRPAAAAGTWPTPDGDVPLDGIASEGGASAGSGSRLLVLPFAAPAVDAGRSGWMEVRSSGTAPEVALNGRPLAAGTAPRRPYSGSLLRPGLNNLSLRFAAQAGSAATFLGGSLRLPPAPVPGAALETLPEPLLSDQGGLVVALARLEDGVLGAALRAFFAFGARGGSVTRPLRVKEASAFDSRSLGGGSSLVAVGGSAGNRQLEQLRGRLRAAWQDPGSGDGALVALEALPGQVAGLRRPHFQLWIDGSSPLLLQAAATVLSRPALAGSAVRLDASGRIQILAGTDVSPAPAARPAGVVPGLLLAGIGVLAFGAILLGLGWQLCRPLERAW